uniref:Small-subunit processome Utp12 domain-containing protein n=1 Tax=Romanomermis culicivorax TaxID=13658 RepID=A0A915KQ32_ROMCU
MSEFGNLALIDGSDSEDELKKSRIRLPGVKSGDLGQRNHQLDIRVFALQFSPTGRSWIACTTEGLLIYSLDEHILFDPYQLETNITPLKIKSLVINGEFTEALIMALKLNDQNLISECVEKIPTDRIDFVCRELPIVYVEKLLSFIGGKQFAQTNHVHFYLIWINKILLNQTSSLKARSTSLTSIITALQQTLSKRYQEIRRICDHNKYSLNYVNNVRTLKTINLEKETRLIQDDENLIIADDEE